MIYLSFLLLLVLLIMAAFFSIKKIVFEHKTQYLLYFLLASLPFYLTFQVLAFQSLNVLWLGSVIRYSKDLFIFGSIIVWLLYKKNLWSEPFSVSKLDYYFLAFLLLVLIFFFGQIGPASFTNQIIYLRGIILISVIYFFGRNCRLEEHEVKTLLHLIIGVSFLAFPIVLFEKLTNTHLQSLIGFTSFQIAEGTEPTGRYGLTWTFEAESGAKRFASFFASPLELATYSILSFLSAFALWRMNYRHKLIYGISMLISFLSLIFSYSRAPLIGFFLMLAFLVLVFGYWRYLFVLAVATLFFFGLIFVFADEGLRYFIIDTITLSDSSSSGHVIEWLLGLESMISNPLGLGLATSGNGGGVEDAVKVGGENQFIVYGVQLGWVGMILYLLMIIMSINISKKAFKLNMNNYNGIIPLVSGGFKVAFVMSLLTANAEIYGLVVFVSWWMVGYSVKLYYRGPSKEKVLIASG